MGYPHPYAAGQDCPVRVDTHLADALSPEDVDAWVQSATILHSNGDGLDIAVKDGRTVVAEIGTNYGQDLSTQILVS